MIQTENFDLQTTHRQPYMDELENAIRQADEHLLGEVLFLRAGEEGLHDALAEKSNRLAFSTPEGKATFCELYLTPVIQKANAPDVLSGEVLNKSKAAVLMALRNWMPQNMIRLVPSVIKYELFSCWSLKNTRDAIMAAAVGRKETETSQVVMTNLDLPKGAPELGFIFTPTYSFSGWPEVPYTSAVTDTRFKQVTSKALSLASATGMSDVEYPIVLTPNKLSVAVSDGLCAWLEELHQFCCIRGWLLEPFTGNLDVMKITLQLGDEEPSWTQFCLRLHQLGAQGLNDLLSYLSETAPNLETVDFQGDGKEVLPRGLH